MEDNDDDDDEEGGDDHCVQGVDIFAAAPASVLSSLSTTTIYSSPWPLYSTGGTPHTLLWWCYTGTVATPGQVTTLQSAIHNTQLQLQDLFYLLALWLSEYYVYRYILLSDIYE